MDRKMLFLVVLLGLFTSIQASAEPGELRIGVLSGLSGIAAKWNRFQNMGIELAREELNRDGWKITTVVEDSQSLGTKAVSAFDKLVLFDRVDAIIADDFGFAITPLIPKLTQLRKLFVALSLPHDGYCSESSGYFFSITSQFSRSAGAFERFFQLHPELRRIALAVFDDQEWGLTYRTMWENLARQHGVKIVDILLTNDFQPDYKTFFARLMPKKADAIFIAHEPESFAKVKEQFGFRGMVVSANNVLEMLTDQPVRHEMEGYYVVDPVISEQFRSAFLERFQREPILEAYAGYEAMRAVARAFDADKAAPQLGMHKVKYQGVAGPIDFSGSSCVGNYSDWGLFRFENGKMIRQ